MAHMPSNGNPLEKNFSKNGQALHTDAQLRDDALTRIHTAGGFTISPELFEKLYLTPANKVKGDLRQQFGNPTPLSVHLSLEKGIPFILRCLQRAEVLLDSLSH